jgi:rare lipoprotein A
VQEAWQATKILRTPLRTAPYIWYYRRVQRLRYLICALLILSACGRKKVPVAAPSLPASPSATTSTASVSTGSFVPKSDLEGIASYYAEPYNGRPTANGEIFNTYEQLTAAHRTLPFNTMVRVTNKTNGQEVDVRINDRGPFIDGRVIDLSVAAAKKIDMVRAGVVPVKLTIIKAGTVAAAKPVSGAKNPPSSSPSNQSWFAVQVGAFSNEQAAQDLKKRLERKFSGVSVQTLAGSQTVYRVRVGHEQDLQTAEKLAQQLRKESLDSFVVRGN